MKTEAWIELLSRDAGPAPRSLVTKRLTPAVAFGLLASAWASIAVFGLIPLSMFGTSVPWTKLAYAGALAIAAGWWAVRLSRPGATEGRPRRVALGVVMLMAAVGLMSWLSQPTAERLAALLGHSWLSCAPSVLAVSVPALTAALWALRGLAPTRPRVAGFAAGVLAGSIGAMGYSLSCPESSAAFVAVWYSLGILLTSGLGALLGPRVLDW